MILMMTSSSGNIFALLALCAGNSPITGEFPAQRPVTQSFDVFFDLRLNKRLSKQLWGWWFETPSRPLWRQCNVLKWWSHVLMTRLHFISQIDYNYTNADFIIAIYIYNHNLTWKMIPFQTGVYPIHIKPFSTNYKAIHPYVTSLIAWFMGPTWGPLGDERTQVGPMLAPWTLLSGILRVKVTRL